METGEYLRKLRIERKLSLPEVAKAVILDEKILGDIEQDTASHIAVLYRNGYIQTYARFLDVPEDEIPALLASVGEVKPDLHNVFSGHAGARAKHPDQQPLFGCYKGVLPLVGDGPPVGR